MSDNTHAAMCIYCGEKVIYDTRKVNDMAAAHAQLTEHDQQCSKNPLVEDLARHKRMFVAACETLGEIQQALGNSIVGCEPALVKELVEERDALAAHVDRLVTASNDAISQPRSCMMVAQWERTVKDSPDTSLARREAQKQIEAFEAAISAIDSDLGSAKGQITGMLIYCRRQAEDPTARSNCPDCEDNGNIAFVTCPICDGEGKLSNDEAARLHAERLAAQMDSCELECGAYRTYCKCSAEAQQ